MRISRKLCVIALEWCRKKYGKSEYHRAYPLLRFRTKSELDEEKEPMYGIYEEAENTIYVYGSEHSKENDPVLAVVNTIIHEYKHYLQNLDNYDKYLDVYKYTYDTHPYEKTANKFADKEQYECYYHVITTMRKIKKKRPRLT